MATKRKPSDRLRVDWSKLTEKQRDMVKRFMKTGNKLGSYTEAYYGAGWEHRIKYKTLISNCYKEFKKPHIAVIVDQIQQRAVEKAGIKFDEIMDENVDDLVEQWVEIEQSSVDAAWVLKRAVLLADFNINKFIKVIGNEAVYDFTQATEDDWYCISEYTHDSSFVKGDMGVIPVEKLRLKSYDKLRALELVGKHIDVGAFKEVVEHTGKTETVIIRDDDANL